MVSCELGRAGRVFGSQRLNLIRICSLGSGSSGTWNSLVMSPHMARLWLYVTPSELRTHAPLRLPPLSCSASKAQLWPTSPSHPSFVGSFFSPLNSRSEKKISVRLLCVHHGSTGVLVSWGVLGKCHARTISLLIYCWCLHATLWVQQYNEAGDTILPYSFRKSLFQYHTNENWVFVHSLQSGQDRDHIAVSRL